MNTGRSLPCLTVVPLAHGANEAPTDEVVVQASRAKLTLLAWRYQDMLGVIDGMTTESK